jgi:hypothetical protein
VAGFVLSTSPAGARASTNLASMSVSKQGRGEEDEDAGLDPLDDIGIAPLGAGKAELPRLPAGHLSCHTRPWRHVIDG